MQIFIIIHGCDDLLCYTTVLDYQLKNFQKKKKSDSVRARWDMAFSSWLFWLFAQKARLFWLFAKLGYIVVAFVDVYKLIYHFFHYKTLFTSIFWLFPGFCKKTVCSARLLYLAVRKWQNGNLERKIWAFSQKMRWLFWLFLYLSLCKMAFSSLAFCQKSHVRLTLSTQWLFWLLPGFFLEEKAREKAVPIHSCAVLRYGTQKYGYSVAMQC